MPKLNSNNMYMMPFDSPIYALVPERVWWAPWLWNLYVCYWSDKHLGQRVAHRVRESECIDIMRFFNCPFNFK